MTDPKENTDSIEVIERWADKGGDTEYSVDGGKVWWTKEQYDAVKAYAEKLVHQARVDAVEEYKESCKGKLLRRSPEIERTKPIRFKELEGKEESI